MRVNSLWIYFSCPPSIDTPVSGRATTLLRSAPCFRSRHDTSPPITARPWSIKRLRPPRGSQVGPLFTKALALAKRNSITRPFHPTLPAPHFGTHEVEQSSQPARLIPPRFGTACRPAQSFKLLSRPPSHRTCLCGGGGGAVEVSAANAQELPFGDGSFDRYMANLSLMLVPEPEVAARARRARAPRPPAVPGHGSRHA
jgi:hypothetical protein